MIPIFFNSVGVGLLVLGLILGYALQLVIGLMVKLDGSNSIVELVTGLAMVGDLLYRQGNIPYDGCARFIHPKMGGNIMFIPAWLIGAFAFLDAATKIFR
jgi:hypothetical protein